MGWGYSDWAPYVPVEERRRKARAAAERLAKKQNRQPQPVVANGSKLAKTFWGRAWCDHLHAFHDYANRLPRGATYLRNGSVVDLVIQEGRVDALVAGSETYQIAITIQPLDQNHWKTIRKNCSQSIDSLLDLLAGRLSDGVMRILTDRDSGLFPKPREIRMKCNCPDSASVCKHLAAVMYGVGVRLDTQPELLFQLRGVDHQELVSEAVTADTLDRELGGPSPGSLAEADLGAMFGIELDLGVPGATATGTEDVSPGQRNTRATRPAAAKKQRGAAATGRVQPKSAAATVSEVASTARPPATSAVGQKSAKSTRSARAKRSGAGAAKAVGRPLTVAGAKPKSSPKKPSRVSVQAGKAKSLPVATKPTGRGPAATGKAVGRQAVTSREASPRTKLQGAVGNVGTEAPETPRSPKPRQPKQKRSPLPVPRGRSRKSKRA
jgi:uncharacterized Zn finger protein